MWMNFQKDVTEIKCFSSGFLFQNSDSFVRAPCVSDEHLQKTELIQRGAV